MPPVRFSEPIQVVELVVPRCSLSFGVAPCAASLDDGPRCYQQWGGCFSKATFNNDATIRWRFMKPMARAMELYERVGDDVSTNPFFMLESVSVSESRINVGSIRDGDAPLGITGGATITFRDQPFDDYIGDPYRSLRPAVNVQSGFWAKFFQRVPYFLNIRVNIYEGFWGQALSEMTRRTYIMDGATGPDSNDRVSISAVDPLRLTDAKRASFPPEMDMQLVADLASGSTADFRVQVGTTGDLEIILGNTSTKYISIGSEIIGYTGASLVPDSGGEWLLTGITRGQLGTTTSAHESSDAVQRTGYFETMDSWEIAQFLLGFTLVPAEFINVGGEWETEASTYLQGYQFSRAIVKPTPVNRLLGELMRDSTFYIWWDELSQRIPLKAIRPEDATAILDENSILRGSFTVRREPKERISRVHIRFGKRDPTANNEFKNFSLSTARIASDEENELAGAEVSSKVIYSEWMINRSVADEVTLRLLARFAQTPVYATARVLGDDIKTGDVVEINYRRLIDTEGFTAVKRWQVTSARQVKFKEETELTLQQFIFQAARFMVWMPDDAGDYEDIPEEGREELIGVGFWANDDGEMPDGTGAWFWQ